MRNGHANPAAPLCLTLAASALAAVYDWQDNRLALSALALQAEIAHRGVRVQAVAAALTHRLEIRLLRGESKKKREGAESEIRAKRVTWIR